MKKLILLFCLIASDLKSQNPNYTPFAFGVSFGGNVSIAKPEGISKAEYTKEASPGYHLGFITSFRKSKCIFAFRF